MNTVHWLLLGLIVLCFLCLFAVFIGKCINGECNDSDEPIYRTADGQAIAKQIKTLRRKRPTSKL